MAANFPVSLDDATTLPAEPAGTVLATNHVIAHQNLQDSMEAVQAKVGIDSSAVTTSHDYKLSEITGSDLSVGKTATQTLTNKTLTAPVITSPVLTVGSDATGDIYYRGAGGFTRLAKGTDAQILKLASGIPAWDDEITTVNASVTVKGIAEEATLAEIDANTAAGATGARLFINPSTLGKSVDGTLADDSDAKIPSQKAVKTYADTEIGESEKAMYYIEASENLKLSADTERNTTAGGYTKLKEILLSYAGSTTVKFSIKAVAGSSVGGRVYVNGAAVGTERSTGETGTYTEYSENFTVNQGDRIQIYLKSTGGGAVLTNNFRIYFDKTLVAEDGAVITD